MIQTDQKTENYIVQEESFPKRLTRTLPYDGISVFEVLSKKNILIIGGGTVGTNATLALARHGFGMENQITVMQPGEELVEDVNLHSAFGQRWVGTTKVLSLREQVDELDPNLQVNIIPESFVSYERDVVLRGLSPDYIISAFDSSYGMAKLHADLYERAKDGEQVPPIILGTDAGVGRVLVHIFDYSSRQPFLGKRGTLGMKLTAEILRKGPEYLKDDPRGKILSLLFAINMLGIQYLDHKLVAALPKMTESYAQHPGAGLHVGNDIALTIRALSLGERVKRVSTHDPERAMLPLDRWVVSAVKDKVARAMLRVNSIGLVNKALAG